MPSSCGHSSGHCYCSQVAGRRASSGAAPSSSANRALMSTGWARISRHSPMGVASKIRCLSSSTDAHTSAVALPGVGEVSVDKEEVVVMPSFRCLRLLVAVAGTRAPAVRMVTLCDGFAKFQAYLSNKWLFDKCINFRNRKASTFSALFRVDKSGQGPCQARRGRRSSACLSCLGHTPRLQRRRVLPTPGSAVTTK